MRKLITILLILFSFAASSQVIRANRYYVPVASCNYFGSDSIPAALYSFRNVNPCRYSGNCVKIRRASDNTTSNFGFVSNYVDTAAIKTFIGSSDAFVDTWYNQGSRGSVIDVKQTTTTKQPKIATAGALIYAKTGYIGVQGDGTNDLIFSDSTLKSVGATPFSLILVSKRTTTAGVGMGVSNGANVQLNAVINQYPTINGVAAYYGSSQITASVGTTNTNLNIVGGYFNSSDFMASDGTSTATTTNTVGATTYTNITLFGYRRNGGVEVYTPGIISEAIGYAVDMRPSRTTIEASIKSYYGL